MQPTRFGDHATFFEVPSFDEAREGKYEVKQEVEKVTEGIPTWLASRTTS